MKIFAEPFEKRPPPLGTQAGAWQRLFFIVLASVFTAWLLSMLHSANEEDHVIHILIGSYLVVVVGIEYIAFTRFRHLVQSKQRSDPQKIYEMMSKFLPSIVYFIFLIRPQEQWNSSHNRTALILAAVVSIIFLTASIAMRRQFAQHAATQASRDRAELERQFAEAKLAALSAQIEPHFLFNTLASIQYLIRNDADKAGEMTSDLIRYLRLALPRMKQVTARLADELDLVHAYLGVMQIRMGERLTFTIDEHGANSNRQIPTMVLITLVENEIKHGLEKKPGGGAISVTVCNDPADMRNLRLEVADTGGGFSSAVSGTGIGLANIRERLNTLYGDDASLTLEVNHPSGVKAILIIPIFNRVNLVEAEKDGLDFRRPLRTQSVVKAR